MLSYSRDQIFVGAGVWAEVNKAITLSLETGKLGVVIKLQVLAA